MLCQGCGHQTSAQARFCERCGAELTISSGTDARLGVGASERRLVTIVFCDLRNFVALTERLEAEDTRNILATYQRRCREIIERHGGYLARYVGDGLLAYFGYPRAHEDDALRAVRAGLEIIPAVQGIELPRNVGGEFTLSLRIGIETGMTVVGDMALGSADEKDAAVGMVPNVAARLQGAAARNTVLIGPGTFAAVQGSIDVKPLGALKLKGVTEAVEAYQVVAEIDAENRFGARIARGLTPLVGRDEELAQLVHAFEQARQGRGGTVHIVAEAGLGKSRLLKQFSDYLSDENCFRIRQFGREEHHNSALFPVVTELKRSFGLELLSPHIDPLSHFKQQLKERQLPLDELKPLGWLLGLDAPPANLSPANIRREVMLAVVRSIELASVRLPTVVLVEDLHWCDPSTCELLRMLAARSQAARLVLITTARPEMAQGLDENQQTIELKSLTPAAQRAMAVNLLGDVGLNAATLDGVLQRAAGIPLFIEEFIRLLQADIAERGEQAELASQLGEDFVPDNLQASLNARLDRVGAARRSAQIAAVIGTHCDLKQLASLAEAPLDVIREQVKTLCEHGFLNTAEVAGAEVIEFGHALMRDAAYQSLLRDDRQRLHQAAAAYIAAEQPEVISERPENLAHHYTRGGAPAKAVQYWYAAGSAAMARSSNLESISHIADGLELIAELPAEEQPLWELRLLMASTPALCATRGYANDEVQDTFSRAYELCSHLGPSEELSIVLYGLWSYYLVRANLQRAGDLAAEMLRVANETKEPLRAMEAQLAAGLVAMYRGQLKPAQTHFENILELWHEDGPQFFTAGEDIRASTKSWLGIVYWHQGETGKARDTAEQSLYRARQLEQPISLAFSLYFTVFLAHFRGDDASVAELAAEGLELCTRYELFWGTICLLQLGWVQSVQAGDDNELRAQGLAQMKTGLGAFRGAGARLTQTYYLVMQAQTLLALGQVDEADSLIREAVAAAEESGEHLWNAELNRLRAEILVARHAASTTDQALRERINEYYEQTISQAEFCGAPALKLRAVNSRAVWLAADGRAIEALPSLRAALAQIDTAHADKDVVRAQELLTAAEASALRAG